MPMSRLTDEELRDLARHIVREMVVKLTEEETVADVAKIWGRYLDQWLGKNLRRLVIFAFVSLSGFVAAKIHVWEALNRWMNK